MKSEEIIAELKRYETELSRILSNFNHTREGIYIERNDDPLFRQYVREILDLYNDALGTNVYSQQIATEFNSSFGYRSSPSFKGVENILATLRASLTRLNRNPDLLVRKQAQEALRLKQNIFIVHGRDEAKRRELKDILKSEFRLNPIVLLEQPDKGCKTIIEKFEHYAQTCSYAIAVFTPDDQVSFDSETYVQARPNVIYELGWFCGKLGRGSTMLLLKEGTSVFSDFGGILQKRFTHNIVEKVIEIRRDLTVAGVIPEI